MYTTVAKVVFSHIDSIIYNTNIIIKIKFLRTCWISGHGFVDLKEHLSESLLSVPSPAENVTASAVLPGEIKVEFDVPLIANGPQDSIYYVVKWMTATSENGVLEGQTAGVQNHNNQRRVRRVVANLKPETTYQIKVQRYCQCSIISFCVN